VLHIKTELGNRKISEPGQESPDLTNERKIMSTKTLRKRIALVAVSAMGFGLLTSVAANAANNITVSAASGASTSTQGWVKDYTAGAGSAVASTTATAKMLLSGQVSFTVGGTASGSAATVSGGSFTMCTGTGATLSADSTTCSTASNTTLYVLAKPSAVGTNMVLASKSTNSAATWASQDVLTISVVASTTVNAFDAANSLFQVNTSGISASSNVDATYTAASGDGTVPGTRVINTGTGYFSYSVKDSNGNALSGAVVGASTTGANCLIGAAAAGTFNSASSTSAASWFQISQATVNTPASCPVTITVNGVPVSTRTFTIEGQVVKVSVDYLGRVRATSATKASTEPDIYLSALDSAGNAIDNVSISSTSVYYNAGYQGLKASITTSPWSTSAIANSSPIVCLLKGVNKAKFQVTNASAATIYTDEQTINCAGSIANYTATLDKSSYVPGDIATLTITAKDSAGSLTNDYAVLGTTTAGEQIAIAGSNMTAVTAPTNADTFTNGVKKYKYIVGSTEGSYQFSVDLPKYDGTTYNQAAVTIPYTIKASSASVTNAEVLDAIVKLIASINKQIAALQKALTKKK